MSHAQTFFALGYLGAMGFWLLLAVFDALSEKWAPLREPSEVTLSLESTTDTGNPVRIPAIIVLRTDLEL